MLTLSFGSFEKMLYDQAQLVMSYLEGYQIALESEAPEALKDRLLFSQVGCCLYRNFFSMSSYATRFQTAIQTLEYIAGSLSDPRGGFYCAEDADSEPSGADASSSHVKKGKTQDLYCGRLLTLDRGRLLCLARKRDSNVA